VVMDNYGTHKHPRAREWFVRHPEFVAHFTPTKCLHAKPKVTHPALGVG
jgi:hypothetical protein